MHLTLFVLYIVSSIHSVCYYADAMGTVASSYQTSGEQSFNPTITLFNRLTPKEGLTVPLHIDSRRTKYIPFYTSILTRSHTYVTVHGFETGSENVWAHELKDNLLKSVDANVFIVDWSNGGDMTNNSINQDIDRAFQVSKLMVEFFNKRRFEKIALNYDKMHFVGHSMGARIADFAMTRMNRRAAHLIALDPNERRWKSFPSALNLVDPDILDFRNLRRLSFEGFLSVLHSDSKNLGIGSKLGTSNVFINGGFNQPGCENEVKDVRTSLKTNCNHEFATKFFKSIALHEFVAEDNSSLKTIKQSFDSEINKCFPIAYLCDDFDSFEKGYCGACEKRYAGGGVRSMCFHVGLPLKQRYFNSLAYELGDSIYTLKTGPNGDCLFTYRILLGIKRRELTTRMRCELDERVFVRIGLSDQPNHSKIPELSPRFVYAKTGNLLQQFMILHQESGQTWLNLEDLDFRSALISFKTDFVGSTIEPSNDQIDTPLKVLRFVDVWGKNISDVQFVALDYMSHPDSTARKAHSFLLTESDIVKQTREDNSPFFDYFATFSSSEQQLQA